MIYNSQPKLHKVYSCISKRLSAMKYEKTKLTTFLHILAHLKENQYNGKYIFTVLVN